MCRGSTAAAGIRGFQQAQLPARAFMLLKAERALPVISPVLTPQPHLQEVAIRQMNTKPKKLIL